ncbi:MAG: cytochrome c maturation protein CcmE [Nitrospinota bacterium]
MNRGQKRILIGALAIVGAISFLVYSGIKETSVYFLTVSEAAKAATPNHDLRIGGMVEIGSIKRDADSLGALFVLTDETSKIPIRYKGTLPDMFQDNTKVVVQGKFDSSGLFKAHTLLTSCPSRYEAAKDEEVAT